MNSFCGDLLTALLRTTLLLAAASVMVLVMLKLARCRSPWLHRVAWCSALTQGWLLAQFSWNIPWFPAKQPQSGAAATMDLSLPIGGLPFGAAGQFELPASQAPADHAASLPAVAQPAAKSTGNLFAQWPTAVAAIWLGGMIGAAGIGLVRYLRFLRKLPASRAVPTHWQQELESTVAAISPRARINLHVTENLGPLLCYVRRGYLLVVPDILWQSLTSPQRIAILRHELGHCRRGDLWKSLAVRALALPHWFNPFARLAVRSFDEASEWACDELAVPDNVATTDYASILLKLCDSAESSEALFPAARGNCVSRRIRRLLAQAKEDSPMKKFTIYSLMACALVLGLFRVQLVGKEAAVDDQTSKQANALVVAAKNTYEATQAGYDAGTVTLDLLFAWSRRWLQAELDAATKDEQRIAAYRAHSSRMKHIYHRTAALHKAQAKGGEFDKFWAVVYHVAEAEAMLRKADPTVKDTISVIMKGNGDIDFDGVGNCKLTEPFSLSKAFARHAELLKHLACDPAESIVVVQAEKGVTAGDIKKLAFVCKEAGFPQVTYKTLLEKLAK